MRLQSGEGNSGSLVTRYRWTICALIFFATTINYMDRQLFSLLVPFFEDDLKLGPTDLALINVCFILPYGFTMLFVGRFIDRVGIKWGLATSFMLWNIASIGHALVNSLSGFMGIRFLLGVGESGMYPAAVKTMTDWFPVRERSLATGFFNAGANLGAILAPVLGVLIAKTMGWRECFVLTGAVGIIWIFFWWSMYRPPNEHPKVNEAERDLIHSDRDDSGPAMSFGQLFSLRPVYGLAIAKALSDAPWWFYLTWMPKFLVDQFKVAPEYMAIAIPVIYIIADVGSVFGGGLSSRFIKQGRAVGPARKAAMLICALAVLPDASEGLLVNIPTVLGVPAVVWVVGFTAIAAGAHQGWSSNLFTLISDTVPKSSVGMAVGLINGSAMIGVTLFQFFVGRSVQVTGSYIAPFVVASLLYLVALAVIQLFIPKVELTTPRKSVSIPLVIAGGLAILAGIGWFQYDMNRPPYASLDDYTVKRQSELKATEAPTALASAKVGWMEAKWYRWHLADGKTKDELVKLDTRGKPFVEGKGAKANKYSGPKETELATP
jgi:ACS family hexuronate transporter-like MFS transporter